MPNFTELSRQVDFEINKAIVDAGNHIQEIAWQGLPEENFGSLREHFFDYIKAQARFQEYRKISEIIDSKETDAVKLQFLQAYRNQVKNRRDKIFEANGAYITPSRQSDSDLDIDAATFRNFVDYWLDKQKEAAIRFVLDEIQHFLEKLILDFANLPLI